MTAPFFDFEGRVVSLLGRIDSAHVDVLADQLLRLETESNNAITLYISSSGGNLIDAFKIVDVLDTLHSRVTAIAMGLIQGSGVLIYAAAHERLILPSALLSTANLWDMPGLDVTPPSGFRSNGIHPRETLMAQLEIQVGCLSPDLARMIREAAMTPRFFTAQEAIALHLADSLVPTHKASKQSTTQPIHHVRSTR